MLILIQDSLYLAKLNKQVISKEFKAKNNDMTLYNSLGQNNLIILEK